MLDLWISVQPVDFGRSEMVRALMMAGMLLVDGEHTRTGQTGPLWTGRDREDA
jgi:hypothetical protein